MYVARMLAKAYPGVVVWSFLGILAWQRWRHQSLDEPVVTAISNRMEFCTEYVPFFEHCLCLELSGSAYFPIISCSVVAEYKVV